MLILLLGPPGCGKTVIGRRLAERLNYTWVDVDDHSMEPEWWCCVSEKLRKLGDQFFIEEEGRLLKEAASTICSGTVVSLTGSNLLDSSVINVLELRKDAIFIYLDVNHNDIIDRLGITKLRKIVGAFTGGLKIEKPITGVDSEDEIEEATTSEQILKIMQARSALYENHFDIRIWPKIGVTADELEHDVAKSLDDYIKARHDAFTSTREMNEKRTWGFSEAILEGLAPERGLFVPKRPLPGFEIGVLQRLSRLRYQDKAKIILEKLIHPSRADPQQIDAMVRCAFNPLNFEDPRIVPVVAVGTSEIYVAELFHGPSGSFKDLSLQLLPQLLSGLMAQNEKHLYLVATTGDTGSAVLSGFERLSSDQKAKVATVVLYPANSVSGVQKRQMVTHNSPNVAVVGIKGDFDVCQQMVKNLMEKEARNQVLLNELGVTFNTANSINWARILFQTVFHFHSYLSLVQKGTIKAGDAVDICIPTGNFSNALSAFLSLKMGIPYSRIICASNSNNVLSDFFNTGLYDIRNREVLHTISPSIDILISSNLERLLWWSLGSHRITELYSSLRNEGFFKLHSDELEKVKSSCHFHAGWCSEDACRDTIKRVYADNGYILDPHTAVAFHVGEKLRTAKEMPLIIASTAHYSKFWDDIESLIGDVRDRSKLVKPKRHEGIESCLTKPNIHDKDLPPDAEEVFQFVRKFASSWFFVPPSKEKR